MKDLISREKALDCFHDWVDKHGDVHTADEITEYQAIEALPTEKLPCALCQYNDLEWDEEPCESCTGENNHFKAVERWIPVSKRLPKENGFYLTKRLPKENGFYLTSTMYGEVYLDGWNGINWERTEEILAWMPLPESYSGE